MTGGNDGFVGGREAERGERIEDGAKMDALTRVSSEAERESPVMGIEPQTGVR